MAEDALVRKLKTLIAFRVFFVTALLGTFFVFQIGYRVFPFPSTVLYLIIALYTISIIYSLALGKVNNLTLAYAQISIDSAAIVALIFLTGAIESWFSSLMLLLVIASAIVLGRNGGYFTATLLSLLYGVLVDLQFYGMLPLPHDPLLKEKDFLYNIFSHIGALYLTAYLMGHLMARLERKEIDFADLTRFNQYVVENTPSGLFTTDLSGRILIFNRAAEEITGLSHTEVFGRMAQEVFPFMGQLGERNRAEETVEFQGEKKVIGLSVSRMRDAKGKEIGFIGVFQDLTELKRMAKEIKEKEQWATIGELSANMAHEIRNPLASLKGSVEMLKEGSASSEHKDKLMSIALSEMDRLNTIIVDFLTYSRPSSIELRDADLSTILNKTVDLLRSRSPENVTIAKDYPERMVMKADPMKLEQVFLNLGINALEAMPGGGDLEIGASLNNGTVEITFSDTGEGIEPTRQEKVFYPFYTSKAGGTGLGLSIAYRIVEDHGGHITVTSAPGEGTTFSIILPETHVEDAR